MTGGIHHVVHAVRDLDAAGETYRRFGFQVGGRNRHPWGTQNRIIQLGSSYIELLSVADAAKIPPHQARHFSFGAFTRDFLVRHEGLSMLALESRDAEADAASFRAAGIGDFAVFHFERTGEGPGGRTVKVGFSLAFAANDDAPHAGFFACQEHYPENFWNPDVQVHANTTSAVAGIVLVADEPERHRGFLSRFAGAELEPAAGGFTVATPRGTVAVIDPESFRRGFGVAPPDISQGLRFAAIRFAVRNLAAAVAALEAGAVEAETRGREIVVGPGAAAGATLVFEAP